MTKSSMYSKDAFLDSYLPVFRKTVESPSLIKHSVYESNLYQNSTNLEDKRPSGQAHLYHSDDGSISSRRPYNHPRSES